MSTAWSLPMVLVIRPMLIFLLSMFQSRLGKGTKSEGRVVHLGVAKAGSVGYYICSRFPISNRRLSKFVGNHNV
jgi:hypothetical protein